LEGGLILRAVRDAMVMSPPLSISTAEIDRMIDILRDALDRTAKDVGVA
jgi:putrescine aminotransferase